MVLTQRLDLKQTQGLVMTPQLQQAIKLLQMSNLELETWLESELTNNPLLERADGTSESTVSGSPEGTADTGGKADTGDGEAAERGAEAAAANQETGRDAAGEEPAAATGTDQEASENLFSNDSSAEQSAYDFQDSGQNSGPGSGAGGSAGGGEDGAALWERIASGKPSLRDHVLAQIAIDFDVPQERVIAGRLLDLLDESGWFTADLAEVSQSLGAPLPVIEAVLTRLQAGDPPGLFARSLKECLALQLREKDRLDPLMQRLLDHLDLLAARDLTALRKATGISAEDLPEMIKELKALHPKPALAFDTAPMQVPPPDILLRPLASGGYAIELNPETLPRILVNERYFAKVQKDARATTEKKYLEERLQNANWIVRALHQRATTIMKVAEEIVRQQDGFLAGGIEKMKPLTLKQVADAVDLHESTVSRVTSNKTMLTHRGLFELKFFFSNAVGDGDEAQAAIAIKAKIKALIAAEGDTILSDDAIAAALSREGVAVARRTVAKYREALHIPASAERRRARQTP